MRQIDHTSGRINSELNGSHIDLYSVFLKDADVVVVSMNRLFTFVNAEPNTIHIIEGLIKDYRVLDKFADLV